MTVVDMELERNKDFIRRYIETWNSGDLEGMAEFWSADMVHHTRTGSHGLEAVKEIVAGFMGAFPDLRFEIDDIVAEGDRVSTRMTAYATNAGSYMGAPATGKPVSCNVFGIARLADGKIVEHWGVTDELHLIEQLGLVPAEYLLAMA